jgi:hypothetical protein
MSVFITQAFKRDASEEWQKIDDQKIKKLRAILASMQEESQSTQLLKKERENADVQTSLDQTRTSVGKRLGECRKKKSTFEKRQEELRKIVQENEQFTRDTDMKIEKAEKKAKEEQVECRKLDEEIKQHSQQLEEFQASKEAELKKISQNSLYKKYLEAVVQEYEEDFEGDIENLINRHKTLEAGNTELHQANQQLTDMLDKTREEWLRVQAKLKDDHLMINSALHDSKMKYERYRAESTDLENRLNSALEEKELKESNVGIIHMAIEQLFTRTVQTCRLQQRKTAMLEYVDSKYGHRLDLVLPSITERLQELQWILEKATASIKAQADGNPVAQAAYEEEEAQVPSFVKKLPEEMKNTGLSGSMTSQPASKTQSAQLPPETKEKKNDSNDTRPSQGPPGDTVFLTEGENP